MAPGDAESGRRSPWVTVVVGTAAVRALQGAQGDLSGYAAPRSVRRQFPRPVALAAELPRVLELIQESGPSGVLYPLVTALRQEMGEETQAPKEVDEVASDIRYRLAMLRPGLQFG